MKRKDAFLIAEGFNLNIYIKYIINKDLFDNNKGIVFGNKDGAWLLEHPVRPPVFPKVTLI